MRSNNWPFTSTEVRPAVISASIAEEPGIVRTETEAGAIEYRKIIGGQLHRINGPAYEAADGFKTWWNDGKCHCETGPAVEQSGFPPQWFLNGKKLNPHKAVKNPGLKAKYSELINSMIVWLIHNS
jgi:hypothetical protein